jgi:hypothetical protein
MRAIVSRHAGRCPSGFSHWSAIDDQQLAVRAIVQAVEPVPRHPLVELHLAAGLAQAAQRRAESHPEAADRVEREPHFDAGARALDHRFHDHLRGLAVLEDVRLHVHGRLRATDGVAHLGVELRAVGEDVDLVAEMNRGLAGDLDDVEEFVAVGADGMRHLVVDPRREEQDEHEPDDEAEADDHPPHGYIVPRKAMGKSANASAARIQRRPSFSITLTQAPVNAWR